MSGERMEHDPAASVEVPAWVVEIEEHNKKRTGRSGPSSARQQVERLCHEVRELSVIIADLKEQRDAVYLVIESIHYEGDRTVAVCHSEAEACRTAEALARKCEQNDHKYVVQRWTNREDVLVAVFDVPMDPIG